MENLALFIKGLMAIGILSLVFASIYIYRVWTKDTDRKVRIGIMGFSIELGPATDVSHEPPITDLSPIKDETKH
ncbi:hypothetical protein [Planktomarina sp.]|uniref:hypothetical protein n=1 Tax=Planktomarina sp. TaxID=2024851 RepID=UPI0032614810